MADVPRMTYQESLDELAKIADSNGNRFRLKLVRRPNAAASSSVHVATFAEATWQHIADAESWISTFCGGGLYILQIFDGADARRQYGMITPSEISGTPREPNPRVCQNAAWTGPVLVSCATPANGAGAVATSPFTLAGESAFGAGSTPRSSADAAVGLSGLFANEKAEISRQKEELREREHRAEVDALRREAKERADRLEQRITDLLVAQKAPEKPAIDIQGLLTGVAAAVAPVIVAITTATTEARKGQIELERARLDREEKARIEEAKERAAAAAAAATRPLIDPQLLEIIKANLEQAKGQAAEFAALMKAQAEGSKNNMEAQAIAQRSMLQTIADIAQLQLKNQGEGGESPGVDWGKVVQGIAGGLAALAAAKQGQVPGAPGGSPGAAPVADQQLPEVPAAESLDKIEDRIRKKESPTEICEALKKILAEDKAAQAEVAAEGGIMQVFEARLDDFANDEKNGPYIQAFLEAAEKIGLVRTRAPSTATA